MERLHEIQAILADEAQRSALTVAELEALEDELRALAEEVDSEDTDDVIETLEEIQATIATVREAREAAEEQAATSAARRADLLADIRGEADEPPPDDDDGDPDGDGERAADDEPEPAPVETPEPVAAAATPARPRVSRVNARRPAAVAATRSTSIDVDDWGLTAAANAPGVQAGARLHSGEDVAGAFLSVIEAQAGFVGQGEQKIPVAFSGADFTRRSSSLRAMFGAERYLDRDPIENERKIRRVTSEPAITAAGGICAPINVSYDMPTVGVTDRPLRGALPRFGADRGGIRTIGVPQMSDVTAGVGVWTHAVDLSPGGAVKNCLTVTCPEDTETLVEAIYQCLKYGNFRAMYFKEQIDAWMRLLGVHQARYAETRLINTIAAGSTAVTTDEGLGATRDMLAVIGRAVAGYRSRYRLGRNAQLRWLAPEWLLELLRTDLAREAPGSADERLAVADATIESFFRVRGVNVTWLLDGETGQVFPAQPAGTLGGWPTSVKHYLFPEGTWIFVDGGRLDVGLIRDSTLVETNDVKFFAETFEGVHFHGLQSLAITSNVCPDGTTAGPDADFDPCTTGS